MLTGQLCPHYHYSPICFSMVHLFTLNGSQTSNCQKIDGMPEEYGKLSNCQLQNYHWICMECMFFAAERRCDEMKHQPIVNSRWGNGKIRLKSVCTFVTRLTNAIVWPYPLKYPPPPHPYPPIPLCLADWWNQWSFIRADLHRHLCTFSLSFPLARFKLDWHRDVICWSPTPPT